MATTSTVPAVKAALVTLLTSAINDSDVYVSQGRPQDDLAQRKVVVVGSVSYSSEIANVKSSRKQRDERYSIEVVFLVYDAAGGTAAEAETAVWTLVAELEDLLADDTTLGGVNGLAWAVLGKVEGDVAVERKGPVAWITADVECMARLT
jgi:hypothetical protein